MKAVVYSRYGTPDDLSIVDVDRPVPAADEVLIRVRVVSLNASDMEFLTGRPLYARVGGLRRPRHPILGSDIAGVVEAVGSAVTRFQVGDEVFGDNLIRMGGFAEYARMRERKLAAKPPELTFEQAAALPQAGTIAYQALRVKNRVGPGHRVLVNGAGGSAGSFLVQLASHDGAYVTGVDHGDKLDFARSLGAEAVVDYRTTDYTATGDRHDLVIDLVAHRSVGDYRRALSPRGRYRYVGGSVGTLAKVLLLGPPVGLATGRRIGMLGIDTTPADLEAVAGLCRDGALTPAIDRSYALAEVPKALRYLASGTARGKLLIVVG